MRCFLTILVHIIRAILILISPGGHKRLITENLALRQQLIVTSRKYQRSPDLTVIDRILLGVTAFFISSNRLRRVAIIVKPATILKFHRALVKRKYKTLYGSKGQKKLGRRGFGSKMIDLIIEIKRNNRRNGCPKIAMLASNATGTTISEATVRRIVRKHFKPTPGEGPLLVNIHWKSDLQPLVTRSI